MNICIIEDEQDYIELFNTHVSRMFKNRDIKIYDFLMDGPVEDKMEELLDNVNKYDIIIVDYEMPQIDGEEVIEKIRSTVQDFKYKPFIMLNSKHNHKSDVCVNMMKAGANDVFLGDKYDFKAMQKYLDKSISARSYMSEILSKASAIGLA